MVQNRTQQVARLVRSGQLALEQVSLRNRSAVEAWLAAHPTAEEQVKDNADAICELAELAAEDEAVSEDNTNAILELAQVILEAQEELEEAIVELADMLGEMEVDTDGEAILETDQKRTDDD